MKTKPDSRNLRTILAFIMLAGVFWFFVKMNKSYDYSAEIPLKIINNNEEYCLKYPVPNTVRVKFHGRGIDLIQLGFYSPLYRVNLSAFSEQYRLDLTQHPTYVHISEDIDVAISSIETPQEIIFEMDHKSVKTVPIVVNCTVETEPGFVLLDQSPKPDSITVTGPASYIDTLSGVQIVPQQYKNVAQAFRDNLDIAQTSEFSAKYDESEVSVFFNVQRLAEKEIANVPVVVTNVPDNLEAVALPSTATVYAKGGEKVLAQAETEDFDVRIHFSTVSPGTEEKSPATISSGLNLTHLEVRPPQFEVILQTKK